MTFAGVANTLEVEFAFLMCGLREGRNNVYGAIQIDARLQESHHWDSWVAVGRKHDVPRPMSAS